MGNTAQSNGSSHTVEVKPIVLLLPQYKNVFLYHLFSSFSSIYRRIHIKQESPYEFSDVITLSHFSIKIVLYLYNEKGRLGDLSDDCVLEVLYRGYIIS
jgi:hypothetical protein